MQEHFQFFLFSLLFSLVLTVTAWSRGYFHIPLHEFVKRPSIGQIVTIFLVFLAIELLLIPTLAGYYVLVKGEGIHLTRQLQGWFTLLAIFASCFGVILYGLFAGGRLFAGRPQDFLFGAASWLLSYPWVIVMGHLVALILIFFLGTAPESEQVAVKQLKLSQEQPMLFAWLMVAIILLVPLTEEILFRGFLQRGLRRYLSPWPAIALTSLIFALFHYSSSQHWNNIELILSLFILSCYLGLIYEKRGSLWAPVGLHMTFNAISVGMIVLMEG